MVNYIDGNYYSYLAKVRGIIHNFALCIRVKLLRESGIVKGELEFKCNNRIHKIYLLKKKGELIE